MKAALYYGLGDVRIEDVPEPSPGPGEVKLAVAYNGLCGSDVHRFYDDVMSIPFEPHPLTGARAPVIIGHELAGTVVEVGKGVDDLEVGQEVAIEPLLVCGTCSFCIDGRYNLCAAKAIHGESTGGGGLAEYTVVKRRMAHVLPPGLGLRHGALVEPMAVSHRAVHRTNARPGDRLVVLGGGPIGIGALLAARARSMDVILVEPAQFRREIAEKLGATVLDPQAVDVVAAVRDLTGGGAASTIDAAGGPDTLATAVAMTRPQGSVVKVAVKFGPETLPQGLWSEIAITGSIVHCGDDFPDVIAAMGSGAYPIDDWVETVPFDGFVEATMPRLRNGEAMKLLVDLGATSGSAASP
jgi:(R,R)-butanediol dehydrogenase/meso-butanediol dehydrogenase/diacetyl reductase